jgi:hypothetical protein
MRRLNRREQVLLGVLVLGGLALHYGLQSDGGLFGRPERKPLPDARELGAPPLVRMDLLAALAVDYEPGGRSLFDYYVPPRPAPEIKPPPPRPQPPPVVEAPPIPPPPKLPPRPAGPPPPDFRYIGAFGPKDRLIAVFDGGKDGVMLARVGDVVQERFKVLEFKYETVVLAYLDQQYSGQTAELKLNPK